MLSYVFLCVSLSHFVVKSSNCLARETVRHNTWEAFCSNYTMIQGTPTQSPWRGSGGVTRGISTTLHSVLSPPSSPRLRGRSQCLTYIWVSSRREETGEMLCQSMWSSWTLLRENTTQHWPRDRERSWSHSQETSISKHTMHMTMILLFSMYTLDNQQPQVEPALVMMYPHIVPLLIHGEEQGL